MHVAGTLSNQQTTTVPLGKIASATTPTMMVVMTIMMMIIEMIIVIIYTILMMIHICNDAGYNDDCDDDFNDEDEIK